jgi:hypothetical protein
MGTVTYDSIDMLAEQLDALRQAQKLQPAMFQTKVYAVELTFENIADETTRRFFRALPTDFMLAPDVVDCLISEGRHLLAESSSYGGSAEPFSTYIRDTLRGTIPPLPDRPVVTDGRCSVQPIP